MNQVTKKVSKLACGAQNENPKGNHQVASPHKIHVKTRCISGAWSCCQSFSMSQLACSAIFLLFTFPLTKKIVLYKTYTEHPIYTTFKVHLSPKYADFFFFLLRETTQYYQIINSVKWLWNVSLFIFFFKVDISVY